MYIYIPSGNTDLAFRILAVDCVDGRAFVISVGIVVQFPVKTPHAVLIGYGGLVVQLAVCSLQNQGNGVAVCPFGLGGGCRDFCVTHEVFFNRPTIGIVDALQIQNIIAYLHRHIILLSGFHSGQLHGSDVVFVFIRSNSQGHGLYVHGNQPGLPYAIIVFLHADSAIGFAARCQGAGYTVEGALCINTAYTDFIDYIIIQNLAAEGRRQHQPCLPAFQCQTFGAVGCRAIEQLAFINMPRD